MKSKFSNDVLEFFKNLEKNNNRDWFNDNKKEFKKIETDVKKTYASLFNLLMTHDDVDQFKMFRIYRDVRFSKNKLPYKTHFGGTFHRKKPELRGGYYLHITPNNESFIATGFWEPNASDLQRIRKEFEMDATEIREIINNKNFIKHFEKLEGESLKTAPRGFDKEHTDIDLIRMKQFIVTRQFSDDEVLSPNFLEEINESYKAMRPYFNYMSDILTTDLNGVSLI